MKRGEYLSDAFNKYNEGKISAEVYDAIVMNINEFCEDEENEEDETEENNMNKNLFVYENHVYEMIDETPTHFVCSPKNTNEGYGYIPKDKTLSLEEYEKHFDLPNRNLEDMKKYNQWIIKEGYSDYGIFSCLECGKYIFGRGICGTPICDACKDKDNFRILIRYCNGDFDTKIYKNYIDAYNEMESEIRKEAIDYSDRYEEIDIEEGYDDGTVICLKYYGFVSGNMSQEDVYWVIETFNMNQI
jgi:hypothetical protein